MDEADRLALVLHLADVMAAEAERRHHLAGGAQRAQRNLIYHERLLRYDVQTGHQPVPVAKEAAVCAETTRSLLSSTRRSVRS